VIDVDSQTPVDGDGHAHHAYGIGSNALILVRPDGYIGPTSGSLGLQPIVNYLRDVAGR